MNNAVFRKTMKTVGKYRSIKLVIAEQRRDYLVSEPNHHATKNFSENLLAIDIRQTITKRENKKVIDLMKDELGEKIIKEFSALRAKT